jgi:hypothetical protein
MVRTLSTAFHSVPYRCDAVCPLSSFLEERAGERRPFKLESR